jgi:hypothetical protein
VTITGTNFTGATAVKIGTTDASSFTVISATSITAVIPAGLTPGIYDITVTTPSGTSATSTADQFTVTVPASNVFNYPNPFNPLSETTKIAFNMNASSQVTIYIFDTVGRIVVKKEFNAIAGYNEVEWDGKDDYGDIVSNGVYLLRMVSNGTLLGKTKPWVIKK